MMIEDRGRDEFSTQNLIKKHERLLADINSYADNIRVLGDRAQRLISEDAPLR